MVDMSGSCDNFWGENALYLFYWEALPLPFPRASGMNFYET